MIIRVSVTKKGNSSVKIIATDRKRVNLYKFLSMDSKQLVQTLWHIRKLNYLFGGQNFISLMLEQK